MGCEAPRSPSFVEKLLEAKANVNAEAGGRCFPLARQFVAAPAPQGVNHLQVH